MVAHDIYLKYARPEEQTCTATDGIVHLRSLTLNLLASDVITRTVVAPMVKVRHCVATILIVSSNIHIGLACPGHTCSGTSIEGA